jgi:hypothetical protein
MACSNSQWIYAIILRLGQGRRGRRSTLHPAQYVLLLKFRIVIKPPSAMAQ